ncbi:hypothetical protein E2562_029102 [Oryza meyeriana var. granulata]|uniref:Rx N-terminal domain-containing protein n=1 Tax=Oryza meyeriana var. granulata TaxID=110450 RepID=A0A6G1CUA2_9ORYZ|nr:hypothetical protein E2562_029102 [Oryza meyeriana var. granulata]
MESVAVNAAQWVVGKALSPLSGGLVEAWAASTELGPNVGAIKMELLYAQGMLHNARDRETSNPALQQLLLELRGLAYDAEDVLDELDYFRIQDDLDDTYEAADEHARGCLHGLLLNGRHTARNVKGCLSAAFSCGGDGEASHHANDEEAVAGSGCTHKLASSARGTIHLVGKCLPCLSFAPEHDAGDDSSAMSMNAKGSRFLCCSCPCRASQSADTMRTPKLKFDRVDLSTRMKHIVEQLKPVCAKVSTILNLELLESCIAMTMSINAEFSKKPGHALVHPSSVAMNRPVTTSGIIDPQFYGRKGEKSRIVKAITQGDYCDKDLTVIPIVGPGGIGKTTLTQHIYREVQDHFDVKVWLLKFEVERCKKIRGIGVAEQQMTATLASSSSPCGNKLEDAHLEQEQQQPGGEDKKATMAAGLLLLPHQLQRTPKFFIGSDPSRLQKLQTDDIERVLAAPICSLLFSSLTELTIASNHEVERFTKEQSEALLLLSSLHHLEFGYCEKLQSLPYGLYRLVSLKILVIYNCPAVRLLSKVDLPSSLEVLDVRDSKNEELKRQCRKLRGTIPVIKDRYY